MLDFDELMTTLIQIQTEIELWIKELESNKKDLLKFYKRGNKSAGIRVRKKLKLLKNKAQELRMDILRLIRERKIMKGSNLEKDYKRRN